MLEGSVRRAGERLRVTGQLIDAGSGHHLWAEKYDRRVDDLFELQDEITDHVCAALQSVIGRSEMERARVKPPASLDAWEGYQRGWWHLTRFSREDFAQAEALFHRAHDLDPSMSQPLSGLARLSGHRGVFNWAPPQQAFAEAERYACAALALDPMDSMALAMLAVALARARRLDEALPLARQAVELAPSNAIANHSLALIRCWRDEAADGVACAERAIRLSANDPLLYLYLSFLSTCLYAAKQYERAAEVSQLSVRRGSHYPLAWRGLANALGQLGRIEEAKAALARFLEMVPSYTSEAVARASTGFRDKALFQHYLEGLRKAGWAG